MKNISNILENKFNEILQRSDLDKVTIKKEIIDLFNITTGNCFQISDLTIDQESTIIKWMNKSNLDFISAKKEYHYKRTWFVNEPEKLKYLQQGHCILCNDPSFALYLGVRIIPKSGNIKNKKIKAKFQEILKNDAYVKHNVDLISLYDRIHLKLIFIINGTRDKDVDNMAKITIDGLKGVLFPDDKQIDHLEVIKFKTNYLEDSIYISLRKSKLNSADNVIFRDLNIYWGSRPRYEI